jgi:hypothetical protein
MSKLRLDGALSVLSLYAFISCTGTIVSQKNGACYYFLYFLLSSPLQCTVVSVERGAGFWGSYEMHWEVRMGRRCGSVWRVAREG